MWKAACALLVLVALLGCQRPPPKAPEPLQRIRVACTVQPQSTLVHIAMAKGYFPGEGLEVETILHAFGKASLQCLLDQRAEFAVVAETPLMFNILKGERLFVLATIEASNSNNAILARKDVGVSAPGDLRGKRIGFTPGTTSEFFLDSFLTTLGLTRQDIQPVPLNPDDMQGAILGKQVAAICTWNYPLTRIRRMLGPQGLIFYDHEIYTETYNLVAQQDFVQKNPETVRRLLRAMVRAEQFAAEHPGEAQTLMSRASGTDLEVVREVWSSFRYRIQLDETILVTLEDETRWAMKQRLTEAKAMPDYRTYLHADSLRAVRPDAVKLPR